MALSSFESKMLVRQTRVASSPISSCEFSWREIVPAALTAMADAVLWKLTSESRGSHDVDALRTYESSPSAVE